MPRRMPDRGHVETFRRHRHLRDLPEMDLEFASSRVGGAHLRDLGADDIETRLPGAYETSAVASSDIEQSSAGSVTSNDLQTTFPHFGSGRFFFLPRFEGMARIVGARDFSLRRP